jgi:hypothetical protein
MKMPVFWDVTPCNLVETSVKFYQTTRRYNAEDSHLDMVTSQKDTSVGYLATRDFI